MPLSLQGVQANVYGVRHVASSHQSLPHLVIIPLVIPLAISEGHLESVLITALTAKLVERISPITGDTFAINVAGLCGRNFSPFQCAI